MKKYFLLATTALLLGTSNVMAAGPEAGNSGAGGSVSATINVTGQIYSTPTINVLNHVNWGTIYAEDCDILGTFAANGFTAGPTVNGATGQQQGRIRVNNLPTDATVSITNSVGLLDGTAEGNAFLGMSEISLSEVSDGEYLVLGSIGCAPNYTLPTGTLSGNLTVTVAY